MTMVWQAGSCAANLTERYNGLVLEAQDREVPAASAISKEMEIAQCPGEACLAHQSGLVQSLRLAQACSNKRRIVCKGRDYPRQRPKLGGKAITERLEKVRRRCRVPCAAQLRLSWERLESN